MPTDDPIILAHGIARFDFLLSSLLHSLGQFGLNLSVPTDGLNYFKGIARHLRSNGFDVSHSSVSFASSVEVRAQDLKTEVNNLLSLRNKQKVHIIAHSMGGLDARHMIVNYDMADRVASLTTIGTPHLGTSFADWGIANQGHDLIVSLKNVLDLEGFEDLTTTRCVQFNEMARNAEAENNVLYHTYAGSEEKAAIFGPLQPSWELINQVEGPNDGLVSVTSQNWQTELVSDSGIKKTISQNPFPVQADHLNEVGWWDLHEIRRIGGLVFSLLANINNYELSIKNAYLEIARKL
jgi:triacylglycerol lipase